MSVTDNLVQFKGELLRHYKEGKGATYERIAHNLALRNDLTILAIQEQQRTYDFLHERLSEIAKGRTGTEPSTMSELLALVEDHVLVTTTACDPARLGVAF